jgi:hypothetical protein
VPIFAIDLSALIAQEKTLPRKHYYNSISPLILACALYNKKKYFLFPGHKRFASTQDHPQSKQGASHQETICVGPTNKYLPGTLS